MPEGAVLHCLWSVIPETSVGWLGLALLLFILFTLSMFLISHVNIHTHSHLPHSKRSVLGLVPLFITVSFMEVLKACKLISFIPGPEDFTVWVSCGLPVFAAGLDASVQVRNQCHKRTGHHLLNSLPCNNWEADRHRALCHISLFLPPKVEHCLGNCCYHCTCIE